MSFASYSTSEKYNGDNHCTISHSTVVVHELTDREFASILTMGDDNADALKVPQVQYEIESGTSDMGESSEEEQDDDEADDEFVLDHWFPSLLHKSMIEFLDDGEDELMLDHPFDILTSNESAEIEEEEDGNSNLAAAAAAAATEQYDDDNHDDELGRYQSHAPKQRKRSKHKHHHHDENEELSVPVEVIHIVL